MDYNLNSIPRADEKFTFNLDINTYYDPLKFWNNNFKSSITTSWQGIVTILKKEGYEIKTTISLKD